MFVDDPESFALLNEEYKIENTINRYNIERLCSKKKNPGYTVLKKVYVATNPLIYK